MPAPDPAHPRPHPNEGEPSRTGWARTLLPHLGGLLILLILLTVHVSQGPAGIGPGTVLDALLDPAPRVDHELVRHVRLPRAVAGVLAGAALGVAGALLQTATRNPLASPATLGVQAGAYLAVVAGVALAPGLATVLPVGLAFAGGLAAGALVYGIAGGHRASPVRLVLAGVAVALALSAATATLQLLFEQSTAGLFFWGAGALAQQGWDATRFALPRLAVAGLLVGLLIGRLDVHALGDDVARGLGQRVHLVRTAVAGLAIYLTAVTVDLVGPIGFVGLVAPHIVRLAGMRRHRHLLPAAAVWGAILLVGADVLARVLHGDVSEIPAGVVTAVLGSPVLILLARRADSTKRRASGRRTENPVRLAHHPYPLLVAGAATGLLLIMGAALTQGAVRLPLTDVLGTLLGGGSSLARFIVLELRLPRALVALLAGASLAVAGVLIQGVVRNPLAAPEIVGVTGGAGVGAMALLLLAPDAPLLLVPVGAFVGAVVALAVVVAASWRDGLDPERLALVGIAVSALAQAVIQLLVVLADVRLAQALAWLSGSVYARGWTELMHLALWPLVLVPVAWVLSRELDVLTLGADTATGLGLPVDRTRLVHLGVAVSLAGAAVATVGTVGFVGLVAPHAARLLAGGRHRRVLPLAALLGAALVLAADVVGRAVLAPAQVPAGLVTAVVGAPYFLWLLKRT